MQIRFGADKALRVLWQQFIGSFLFPLWWSITDSCNICHTKLSKRHNLKEHIKERTKVRLQIITSLQQTHDLKDRCDKPNSRNIFFFFLYHYLIIVCSINWSCLQPFHHRRTAWHLSLVFILKVLIWNLCRQTKMHKNKYKRNITNDYKN